MLSSASDKAKLIAKHFFKKSNVDDSCLPLPLFPSRTNLKWHISVTPKMVKKVITNLDLSKASGSDCIPVVVLDNCEPELSYILAELFNRFFFFFFFNWDAPHARLNSHYEAWSYKKRSTKRSTGYRKSV